MERYENLQKALCKELERLDKKYGSDVGEMSPNDLETADKIYHALKSAATYHAMKDAEDEERNYSGYGDGQPMNGRSYRNNASYARYRNPRTGRYMSREDGYSGGYPMEYIDPYWDRRY